MRRKIAVAAVLAIWTTACAAQFPNFEIEPTNDTQDPAGFGLVIGDTTTSAADIGAGSVLINLHTGQPNVMDTAHARHLRFIAGYDNFLTSGGPNDDGGEASALIWTMHSSILGASTHTTIVGGSNINATGHYIGSVGGTQKTYNADYGGGIGGVGGEVNADFGFLPPGRNNKVNAPYATASGRDANARLPYSETRAPQAFSSGGDAQATDLINKVQSSSCTPAYFPTLPMPPNTVWAFDIIVVARREASNHGAGYRISGVVSKGTSASSVAFIGAPVRAILGSNMTSDANIGLDTATGGIRVRVECAARWVASYRLTEVSGTN